MEPLETFKKNSFSQFGEDGIIREILKRFPLSQHSTIGAANLGLGMAYTFRTQQD